MKTLHGKIVVVTGAAMGIGLALAERAIEEGARGVVLADISGDLNKTVAALRGRLGDKHDVITSIIAVRTNVSRLADLQRLLRITLDKFGTVNVLFNNAGVGGGDGAKSVANADIAKWEWVMGVNFWSVLYGCHTFGKWMISRAQEDETYEGHVCNTASMAAYISGFLGAYSASKSACVAVTERLLQDVFNADVFPRVGVSCLCPAMVVTNILNQSKYEENHGERLPTAAEIDTFARMPGALSPAAVAEAVFDAIRKGDVLYINTHSMITDFAIRARAEAVCKAVVPVGQIRRNAKALRGAMSKL
jgi:NAD(P)-dependent dehydrogenase (short-subunit alcohol dehydrogenase family)|eukprot:g4427.t1